MTRYLTKRITKKFIRKLLAGIGLCTMVCVTGVSAPKPALADIELEHLAYDYDGRLFVCLYSSEETLHYSNVIEFYHIESGETYYSVFHKANFKDRAWTETISLPTGQYYVRGGVYLDTKAKYSLYSKENIIEVTKDATPFICIVGKNEWVEENKHLVDSLYGEIPTPEITPEPVEEPEITVTVAPTPTEFPKMEEHQPTPIPAESEENEPGYQLPWYVKILAGVGGISALLFAINSFTKRR